MVYWHALHGQYGVDMKDPKKFRRDYLKAQVEQVEGGLLLYLKAQVEQVEGGLLLRRSAPPIRRNGDGALPARG